ncbi:MAG: ACT domain-containing protein [Defluviitaleaceae bacterium]|nr:ACT domain-containing protein [Defluviitaleaceae bacterium]
MELQKIKGDFSICKVASMEQVDFSRELLFVAKTPDEISIVSDYIPQNSIAVESGWKALKISGILDFGMIGVVAKISNILADAGISIFVVSTYNTDYILLKAENFDKGLQVLVHEGYTIKEKGDNS